MRALYLFALTLLLTSRAFATVTLITTASNLKTATNSPMPVTGLVLLVASTTDNVFAPPSPNAFVTGDDIIVGRWDLSSMNAPGQLLNLTTMALSGDWNAGDPLKLYWFPSLTLTSLTPGAEGVPYGAYRADLTPDGGDPWITPADGATVSLRFLTDDSTAGGSIAAASGNAGLVVEKIPATITLANLDQAFDGHAKTVMADTAPAGLAVSLTYNGSSTPPTAAGTYSVMATISDANFTGMSAAVLTIRDYSTPTPARITVTGNRTLSLQFFGVPNDIYLIQTTTNLATSQWTTIGTNVVSGDGSFRLGDLPMKNPQDFFRAIKQ